MSEATAFALMVDNPAGSPELYARLRQEISLPAGGRLHVGGPSPDGGWRVIEVFDSEQEAMTFLKERLAPALRAAGVSGPPPRTEVWPLHNIQVAGNRDTVPTGT